MVGYKCNCNHCITYRHSCAFTCKTGRIALRLPLHLRQSASYRPLPHSISRGFGHAHAGLASESAKESVTRRALQYLGYAHAYCFPGFIDRGELLFTAWAIRYGLSTTSSAGGCSKPNSPRSALGTTFGDLEGALARRAGERIGVHVAHAHRHVPPLSASKSLRPFGRMRLRRSWLRSARAFWLDCIASQ